MSETHQHEQTNNNRNLSDVERLYYAMQGTFGGKAPWSSLDLHAQQVFVQSVNNIRAICSLGG
jgi:hypothetical protein